MKKLFLKSLLLLSALIVGTRNVWGTDPTYKLTQVTSVSASNKYVFVRNSHALSNSVSSSKLQTTDSYSTTGLAGTESYVWELELATGGFYLKNVSLNSNQYLNNASSTNMSFGSKSSIWSITITNGVAKITNNSNSNRYIGETSSNSNEYKAYSQDGNGHDFTVYLVEEEGSGGGNSDPSISLSTSVNAPVGGVANGTINVTYNNIASVNSEVLFYESNGTTTATYDWITASINGSNNVAYTINANTSYARTAYMKVHQKNTEVYSGLITISQTGAIFTVNIESPTGGTLEVKNGETSVSDGDAVADGTTLTITATASDGYRFKNWQAVDASTHTYTAVFTYAINAHDVTIKANFDVEYSVNWSVNGNVTSTGVYVKNEIIIFPSRPADILGKKFVGWTATEIAGTQVEAPTLLDYGTKMGTSNVTYYAVYADASGNSGTATLTGSEISSNLASSQMAYGTEKTYTDTSDGITWVACGNTDAASRPWVQLRSKNDAYFKITTSKNIEEVKLTISNTTNQSGGILDITKHGDFSGTVCLESEAKGTPSGAYASSNVVSNDIVTMSLPVSLKTFYIQVTAGARVWGIELTTNNYTYSNYRTSIPATGTITLNAACNDGGIIYGTFYTDIAYEMHDDLVGSVVSVDNTGKLSIDEVYEGGDVVPAYTALLISTADEFVGQKNYTINYTTGGDDYSDYNMLKGTLTADDMTVGEDCLFYRLTMHGGTDIGFWWGAENGGAFKPGANKAYLAVPDDPILAPSHYWFIDDENNTTNIENLEGTEAAVKFIQNGILFIMRDGIIYDITGRIVK